MVYDAASIRILTPEEVDDKFEWALINKLSTEYNRSREWIADGIEACRRSGVGTDYFISYYLEKDPNCPRNKLVEDAYTQMKNENLD